MNWNFLMGGQQAETIPTPSDSNGFNGSDTGSTGSNGAQSNGGQALPAPSGSFGDFNSFMFNSSNSGFNGSDSGFNGSHGHGQFNKGGHGKCGVSVAQVSDCETPTLFLSTSATQIPD